MPVSTSYPSRKTLKIGLIGAGERFKNFFLPVLNAFSDSVQIVGAVTKSGKIASQLGIDVPVYRSIKTLCEQQNPDFLLIVVKAALNYSLCKEAIQFRKLVLIETPVSLDWKKIRQLVKLSHKSGIEVAVAEGWPFLPMENFKQKLINTDLFATIFLVENDFRTYDYHAIAQLRRYLPHHLSLKTNYILRTKRKLDENTDETWRVITATFDNNAVLLSKHNQKRLSIRSNSFKSLRIYSRKATLIAGCLVDEDPKMITYQDFSGNTHSASVHIKYNTHNTIEKIFAELVDYGKVEWVNPYALFPFNEHQIAIAHHFEALVKRLKGEEKILYSIAEHMIDVKMLTQEVVTLHLPSLFNR